MKVLCITKMGYPPRGGAQITNLAFLQKLSEKFGYKCHIYSFFPFKKHAYYRNVKLSTFRDTHELKVMIRKLKPRVAISAMDISHDVLRLTTHLNIPTIVYLQSYEYSPPTDIERKKWKVSRTREYTDTKEARFIFEQSDARVVNSKYMQRRFERKFKMKFQVIYPEFIPDDFLIQDNSTETNKYITGVCGYRYKGADIFYALANNFLDENFLLVGNVDYKFLNKFKNQSNIKFLPFTNTKNFLKLSKIILIPSQWPEPFGRIAVEAMANGIPTLASMTGGLREIVHGTSLGVRRFRDKNAWMNKLQKLLTSKGAMGVNHFEGKSASEKFLKDISIYELFNLIKRVVKKKEPNYSAKKLITLCGNKKANTAYSIINSNWIEILKKENCYDVLSLPNNGKPYNRPIEYYIHHDYQDDFSNISLPDQGKFIAVRTWDFGKFPDRWVDKINQDCDQLWVYSSWTKTQAVRSRINSNRVKVVPPGLDETIFKPTGKIYPLPTDKRFKFIFVGATIMRKGIDLLLKAYGQAFGSKDDVCLVIKDHPKDVFYTGIKFTDKIKNLVEDKTYPEIIYINKYLDTEELASLYRSCNVGVFPYRAEGFSTPILEAMACGVPSIVPKFGACLDFCSECSSFLMPVKRINLPVKRKFIINTFGFREDIDEVDFCEVQVDVLVTFLKRAVSTSNYNLKRKSMTAVQIAHSRFKWSDSVKKIKKHLERLDIYKTPLRLRRKRTEMQKNRKKFEIAKQVYLNR
jgi:glycosyltransferase involved in cell wall biosynthesis